MSTINDVQFIPSNNVVQTEGYKDAVVTHQPRPNYAQTDSQVMQNPYQIPTVPAHMYSNGRILPVSYANVRMNGPYPVVRKTVKVHDYLAWSICNMVCCCLVFGAIAVSMSIQTKTRKRFGDIQGAQSASKWAAILNIGGTIIGIIVIILVIVKYTGHISF